ncbi:short-chain dehydrogenase/reductase family 16C member 6 [Cylas formicarius]|uniref:short-chain dehydrogenase/reductase family 16C member 6 n=1 Tax=Cylas formicarius TaxID=197179 RepID=UPI002958A575|nr:short-chain dehydrogenase/reductase family 16C member 6 [Cylas formicarius]
MPASHKQQKTERLLQSFYVALQEACLRAITRFLDLLIVSWLAVYYFCEALILTLTPSSLRTLKSLRSKTVLVTGGAGGVGQELVTRLARNKAVVVVWDVNEKGMEELKSNLDKEGLKIHTYPVDLADRQNIYKYAEIVKQDIGPVDIVINNAGIVCGQTFLEIPDYMIEKTYKVNTLSCYWTTKAFLPEMIKRGNGHIVTVGSLTGLLGTYNCTDYSGSKFATVGFHESLLIELKSQGYNRIKMTMVCPYFINTGMFEGCKPKQMDMLEPKDVAKSIITAIRKEEIFVTVPTSSRYILPLKNYIPAKLGWLLLYRVLRLPQAMMSMRSFKEVEAA